MELSIVEPGNHTHFYKGVMTMFFLSEFRDYPKDPALKSVGAIHCMPFDKNYGLGKTEAELSKNGVLVADLPEPKLAKGKVTGLLLINPKTNALTYELVDEVVDEGLKPTWVKLIDENNSMKQQISELTIMLGDALLGGM